jgi:hypothetical protein
MKSYKIVFLIIFISNIYYAHCQSDIPFVPFTLRPITSGPVSLALGGASIVNMDDPFLAIQNPAKLPLTSFPQFTFGLYSAIFKEISDLDHDCFSGMEGSNVNELKMNYLGMSYPFRLFSMNMAAAISYYPLYSLERSISFYQNDEQQITNKRQWRLNQDGYMSSISVAYGVQFHPDWSLGFSVNFFQNDLFDNQLTQETSMTGSRKSVIQFDENLRQSLSHEYSGSNFNLGLLWQISPHLKAGAVFQTRRDNKIKTITTENYVFNGNPSGSNQIISGTADLEIPMSWGIGLRYLLINNWKLLMDFREISWEELRYKKAGDTTQYISGHTERPQDLNVHMIHVGSVYQSKHAMGFFVPVFRMGFSFCTDRGMIHPEPDSTIGFGLGFIGRNLDVNIGYQYQRYDDIVQETSQAGTLRDRIRNNVIEMSLTYRIKK